MASLNACRRISPLRSLYSRSFHVSRTALASDQLFSPGADNKSVDLATLGPEKPLRSATHPPPSLRFTRRRPHGPRVLTAEVRAVRFEALYAEVAAACVRGPAGNREGVTYGAMSRLFQLAQSGQDLEKVSQLFPGWKDSGRTLTEQHTLLFIDRCTYLKNQSLAIKVFTNPSHFGFPLHSTAAARALLHASHIALPLHDTLTASLIMKSHGLPPATSDTVTLAFLVRAYLRTAASGKRHQDTGLPTERRSLAALQLAEQLVPRLREKLLNKKGVPAKITITKPIPRGTVNQGEYLQRRQLEWDVKKIMGHLKTFGMEHEWAGKWLQQEGATRAAKVRTRASAS